MREGVIKRRRRLPRSRPNHKHKLQPSKSHAKHLLSKDTRNLKSLSQNLLLSQKQRRKHLYTIRLRNSLDMRLRHINKSRNCRPKSLDQSTFLKRRSPISLQNTKCLTKYFLVSNTVTVLSSNISLASVKSLKSSMILSSLKMESSASLTL
jgi:hypothetical protein